MGAVPRGWLRCGPPTTSGCGRSARPSSGNECDVQLASLPHVGQAEPRRADEMRRSGLPSGNGNDPNGRMGQRAPGLPRRPAEDRRALQAEEDQDPAEEAFNGCALAQLLGGPGRRQSVALLLSLWVPRNDSSGVQGGMYPGDELEAPITSIQADHPWAQRQKPDGQLQEGPSEGRIMDVGRGEAE